MKQFQLTSILKVSIIIFHLFFLRFTLSFSLSNCHFLSTTTRPIESLSSSTTTTPTVLQMSSTSSNQPHCPNVLFVECGWVMKCIYFFPCVGHAYLYKVFYVFYVLFFSFGRFGNDSHGQSSTKAAGMLQNKIMIMISIKTIINE